MQSFPQENCEVYASGSGRGTRNLIQNLLFTQSSLFLSGILHKLEENGTPKLFLKCIKGLFRS